METINQKSSSMKRCFIKFCTECSYNFSHRSAYLRHMKNIHGILSTDLPPPRSVQVKPNQIQYLSLNL